MLGAVLAAVTVFAAPAVAQSYSAGTRYPNPDAETAAARQRGPCNDPWVTIALERVYGRADPALCAPALYRGGSWGSFNDLIHAVAATRNATPAGWLRVVPVRGASYNMIGVFNGGTLVAAGGGNLVAAGGGNLVAAGGGNIRIVNNQLVAAGGGNLVSPGGGNIAPVANFSPASGGGYGLQSTGGAQTMRLPVGSIVIR
jgi:hypothetical protein